MDPDFGQVRHCTLLDAPESFFISKKYIQHFLAENSKAVDFVTEQGSME